MCGEDLRVERRESFKVGDWIEVRSLAEIRVTLDARATLDALPFMPEMARYCGQRFKVFKRAHKACDTLGTYMNRGMADAVHLDLRCDGSAHGDCQAGCLIYWKTAWLKPVEGPLPEDGAAPVAGRPATSDLERLEAATRQEVILMLRSDDVSRLDGQSEWASKSTSQEKRHRQQSSCGPWSYECTDLSKSGRTVSRATFDL